MKVKVKKCINIGLTLMMTYLVLFSSLPASAKDSPQIHPKVPPATDKIVPDLFPLDNVLNPLSPKYNPNFIYGANGTRFGPPETRTAIDNGPALLSGSGHEWWGTGIKATGYEGGARAYMRARTDVALDEGDVLYAPTLLGPYYCPLESVTWYQGVSGGT